MATVHAMAGFAANQALVEQTSRTPSAATTSAPYNRATGWR